MLERNNNSNETRDNRAEPSCHPVMPGQGEAGPVAFTVAWLWAQGQLWLLEPLRTGETCGINMGGPQSPESLKVKLTGLSDRKGRRQRTENAFKM